MKYLMLICTDGVSTPEIASAMREHTPAWVEEMDAAAHGCSATGCWARTRPRRCASATARR